MFWAAAAIGAVVVPLNAWWKTEELEFGLRDSGAKLLFCDPKRWQAVRDRVDALPELEHVFVMDLDEPDGAARPGVELLGDDPGTLPDAAVDEDDLLAILYTSGTTGRPKGATLTHRQALANLQNIFCLGIANASRGGEAAPELASDVQSATLLVVPLFHVTGCLSTMMLSYASGAKLVLMPPGRFDPDAAMATIEREQVTSFGGVPTIMWRIVESPNFERYDLSTVLRVSYGGAPAAPELVQRIHERFPKVRKTLATAYGLTETASVATSNTGDDYGTHPDSVGRPAPTVEIEVVDADGAPVATGATGEIWLRGADDHAPRVLEPARRDRRGDHPRRLVPQRRHRPLRRRRVPLPRRPGEGHDHPGRRERVLRRDRAGAVRASRRRRRRGRRRPAQGARRGGQGGRAAQARLDRTAEDLRAYCSERLANFKVPEYVELRDEPLPRNPAGKVLKNLLRGDETSFSADPTTTPRSDAAARGLEGRRSKRSCSTCTSGSGTSRSSPTGSPASCASPPGAWRAGAGAGSGS